MAARSRAGGPRAASWIVPLARPSEPRLRLLCIPYAGGGVTAFRAWRDQLPADVEVWATRPPGRETRIGEPPLSSAVAWVEQLASVVCAAGPLPYALFGHSMGALVCFELARELRRRGMDEPALLIASGRRAPQIPDPLPHICQLPDHEFLEAVVRLNGIPGPVLSHPEVMRVLLPALRADFTVVETYRYSEERPLACPIFAFGGDRDPTTSPSQLAAWREQTTGPFRLRMLSGDHFFVHTERAALLRAIGADLAA